MDDQVWTIADGDHGNPHDLPQQNHAVSCHPEGIDFSSTPNLPNTGKPPRSPNSIACKENSTGHESLADKNKGTIQNLNRMEKESIVCPGTVSLGFTSRRMSSESESEVAQSTSANASTDNLLAVQKDLPYADKRMSASDSLKSLTEKPYEHAKFTLPQAFSINMMNMFGTGPFITIPFLLASWDPPGPHALTGYSIATLVAICDSFVWAELSSLMPHSGGTYVYVRECFGKDTLGRVLAFFYLWQFMVSAPLEIASGFTAMSQYLAYITNMNTFWQHGVVGCTFCLLTVMILYRDIKLVGRTTIVLGMVTLAAIAFTIVAGFSHFHVENLRMPKDAFASSTSVILGLGVGMRIGIYDFSGYQDVCQMGDEVQRPRRNLPLACVGTCASVSVIYFAVYLAVLGYLPWDGPDGVVPLAEEGGASSNYIMAVFCERMFSRGLAVAFALVVVVTIFGSCVALLMGYTMVLYAAASGGYFFNIFAHEHATKKGLADYALVTLGLFSACCCFIDLSELIEAMLVPRLVLQYIVQTVGLMRIRGKFKHDTELYRMPLYPLPCVVVILGFGFCFATTDNWFLSGNAPLLDLVIMHTFCGGPAYLAWAKKNSYYPFRCSQLLHHAHQSNRATSTDRERVTA